MAFLAKLKPYAPYFQAAATVAAGIAVAVGGDVPTGLTAILAGLGALGVHLTPAAPTTK